MRQNLYYMFLISTLSFLLIGCGQMGPLYLPEKAPPPAHNNTVSTSTDHTKQ